MGSQYEGDETNYPEDFTIPDDGDAKDGTSVNTAFEALGDRTNWLRAHSPRIKSQPFLTDGSIVVPPRCTRALYRMCGGGGGGGGGGRGASGTNVQTCGGGGGGGAAERWGLPSDLNPGDTLDVVVGDGGDGGAIDGGEGAKGHDSTITVSGGAELARAPGAGGGAGGRQVAGGTKFVFAYGGRCAYGNDLYGGGYPQQANPTFGAFTRCFTVASIDFYCEVPPGGGGFGQTNNTISLTGPIYSPMGLGMAQYGSRYLGGVSPQTPTTNPSSYMGGGYGGGGGGGPYGVGGGTGGGGLGTNGNSGGNSGDATDGDAADANTGGGGQGGGASGSCSGTPGHGGKGGKGGSGYVEIIWVEDDS